jgi:hypothetical protein
MDSPSLCAVKVGHGWQTVTVAILVRRGRDIGFSFLEDFFAKALLIQINQCFSHTRHN